MIAIFTSNFTKLNDKQTPTKLIVINLHCNLWSNLQCARMFHTTITRVRSPLFIDKRWQFEREKWMIRMIVHESSWPLWAYACFCIWKKPRRALLLSLDPIIRIKNRFRRAFIRMTTDRLCYFIIGECALPESRRHNPSPSNPNWHSPIATFSRMKNRSLRPHTGRL